MRKIAVIDERAGTRGWARIRLYRAGGRIDERLVTNVITDAGDLYHASRTMPGGAAGPAVSGMKLGTDSTAATKNGPPRAGECFWDTSDGKH